MIDWWFLILLKQNGYWIETIVNCTHFQNTFVRHLSRGTALLRGIGNCRKATAFFGFIRISGSATFVAPAIPDLKDTDESVKKTLMLIMGYDSKELGIVKTMSSNGMFSGVFSDIFWRASNIFRIIQTRKIPHLHLLL